MKKSISLLVLVAIFLIAITTPIMANEVKKISEAEFFQKTGLTVEEVIEDDDPGATILEVIITEDEFAFYIEAGGKLTILLK